MRNIIFILAVSLTFNVIAQDPQLFENTWYLDKINVDGTDYIPPSNNEVPQVVLIFSMPNNFETYVCDSMSSTLLFPANNEFEMGEPGFTLGGCSQNDNAVFQELYFFEVFVDPISDVPYNPFEYQITTNPDNSKSLVIISNNGDQAFYGNTPLAIEDTKLENFSLYPNPVGDLLHIQSQEPLQQVTFYDVLGQSIMTVHKDFEAIPVSNLPTGLYFVEVRTSQGAVVKRVVKE